MEGGEEEAGGKLEGWKIGSSNGREVACLLPASSVWLPDPGSLHNCPPRWKWQATVWVWLVHGCHLARFSPLIFQKNTSGPFGSLSISYD